MAEVVNLFRKKELVVTIEGISALITHRFSESTKKQIEEKQQGKSVGGKKPPRDPEKEMREALYFTKDGKYGFPAIALKKAIVRAAKAAGLTMTDIRNAIFVFNPHDPDDLIIPLTEADGPYLRADRVVIGRGETSIAYRPEFRKWKADVRIQYNANIVNAQAVVQLVDLAGFAVGIGDWRPEKDGQFGRFRVAEEEEGA